MGYVVGTWTDLAFQEMVCEDEETSLFSLEVPLPEWGGDFLIVRDKDWMQVFHPVQPGYEEAAGPDPMQLSAGTWCLGGTPGDLFKITFQRYLDESGKGLQQAAWERIGTVELNQEMVVLQQQRSFHIVGTWDGWAAPQKMNWNGTHFQFYIELGSSETASFRILKDANPDQCFYPSVEDASPGDKYEIQGPGRAPGIGNQWTIGKDEWNGRKDSAEKGKRYEIRLNVEEGVPKRVDWTAMIGGACLEDALCRGFFAF